MFDINTLYAGALWSAIGSGFFIYGKKEGSSPALICGLGLVAITFFIYKPLILSLVAIGLISASIYAIKRGY